MGFLGFTLAIIGAMGAVVVILIATFILTGVNFIAAVIMSLRKKKPEAVCTFLAFGIFLVSFVVMTYHVVNFMTPENTIIHSSQGDIEVEWEEEYDITTAIEEDNVKKLEKLLKGKEVFRRVLREGVCLKQTHYSDIIRSYEEEMEWLDIKKEHPEEYKNGLEMIQEEWGEEE